ncbi:MAG TPA: ABC transporter ATP-binding protein [Thermoleophilaceae bacterium]|nr:ABC transporter ATP-binding protein [Thermoleophilaceae bacterium]
MSLEDDRDAHRGAPALEARDVRVTIGDKTILHAADLTLEAGRLVAVVGPNGAGKSTLARAVAGMQKTAAGAIRWMGEDLGRLRGRRLALTRAFVPQRARVPDGVTVTEAVRIGRSPHLKPLQRPTGRDHDAVASAIERAGVTQFAERKLTTLSGGELQRVQIAVALAQEAPVLMADEPTSHLDLGATVSVAKLLRGLADEGLAVMLVAHDLSLAAAVADTVVVMSEGRTVAAGPPLEALSAERLEHVWGVDASVQAAGDHTALHVAWLGGDRPPTNS